jgi:hypothetical protein
MPGDKNLIRKRHQYINHFSKKSCIIDIMELTTEQCGFKYICFAMGYCDLNDKN